MDDESHIFPYEAGKGSAEVRGGLRDVHLTPRLFSYSVSDSSLTPISLIWVYKLSSEKSLRENLSVFSVYWDISPAIWPLL
jgi:hypothetical protein